MRFKPLFIKLHWILSSQFGFDPRVFIRSLRGIPFYVRDWLAFRRQYQGRMDFMPCLNDRFEEGGATRSEYFWQDLLVARAIAKSNPTKHVDIGSRVDGFVAHVASFRECEVFDVRPIHTVVPGIVFRQADLMNPPPFMKSSEGGYCDSLSCLHAIEHFGLGRYGDPIDPLGYEKGIESMSGLLQVGGVFYLSTPIGRERVEFNANRVFDPRRIIRCANDRGLRLEKLIVITSERGPQEVEISEFRMAELAAEEYMLGLFIFCKV